MTEMKIQMQPHHVSDFVKKTQKCSFNVDIVYGRCEVDAKSLLGVLSLDFNRPICVRMSGHNPELESFLKELAV